MIDAANIDLNGFTLAWYRRLGGNLETVKRSISLAAEQCHVEVTTFVIPGENDSEEEIRSLAQWLASVDRDRAGRSKQFGAPMAVAAWLYKCLQY